MHLQKNRGISIQRSPGIASSDFSFQQTRPLSHPTPLETQDKERQNRIYKGERRFFVIGVVIVFLFVTTQCVIILLSKNGPFYDEGIYITAGLRSLQGKGVDDGYMVWFAGSLLWPVMAGFSYLVGGLLAVHFLTLLLSTISLIAIGLSTRNLFGAKVACFSVLALAVNGPFLALAHLGVYDSPALAFTAISFWCLSELQHCQHRAWICAGAISFALAVIAKYPIGLMILPLLGLLFVLHSEHRITNIFLFLFIFVATFLGFFLSFQYQVGYWLAWSAAHKPTFNATPTTIIFAQLYFGLLPFFLAIFGFLLSKKRQIAIILLLSGLIWPCYHILSGNPVSDNKHVVFGFLFTYPLIGVILTSLWEKKVLGKCIVSIIFIGLTILGSLQLYRLDFSWPDVRPEATYLMQHVHPGDQLLINDAWPYTMYLYANHNITSPWDVFDVYRINDHESNKNVCAYKWFVDEQQGSYTWPESIVAQLEACHSFIAVFQGTTSIMGLGSNLQYVTYSIHTTIWENKSLAEVTSVPNRSLSPRIGHIPLYL